MTHLVISPDNYDPITGPGIAGNPRSYTDERDWIRPPVSLGPRAAGLGRCTGLFHALAAAPIRPTIPATVRLSHRPLWYVGPSWPRSARSWESESKSLVDQRMNIANP